MEILDRIRQWNHSPLSPNSQLNRAELLLAQAIRPRFDGRRDGEAMLIGAVYFAVAFFENVLELFADGSGAKTEEQRAVRELFLARVPHLELLEDIRAQDFHRGPVPIPVRGLLHLGPIAFKVGGGGALAGLTFTPEEGTALPYSRGNAVVRQNRPLSIAGYKVANDSGVGVDVRAALSEYIAAGRALLNAAG